MRIGVTNISPESVQLISEKRLQLEQKAGKGTTEIMDVLELGTENAVDKDMQNYVIDFDEVSWYAEYAHDPSRGQQALLEWTLIGSAKDYSEKLDLINSDFSDEDIRRQMIDRLDRSYSSIVGSKIKDITSKFDSYFDIGNHLLSGYIDEPLTDLFDSDVFAGHMADFALLAKETYLNSEDDVSVSDVESILNKSVGHNGMAEVMTYSDMNSVIGFISKPRDYTDLLNKAGAELGKAVAERENASRGEIRGMGLSRGLSKKLFEVESRWSEGFMRAGAFKEEEDNYEALKEKLLESYKRLLERLSLIEMKIQELKDRNLFDPENDFLMNLLERQGLLQEDLRDMKRQIDENDEQFEELSDDPSKIVEKDSYKMVRAGYDSVIE